MSKNRTTEPDPSIHNQYWKKYLQHNNPLHPDYDPRVEKQPLLPIENFVFKGGGTKVTGAIGVIDYLQKEQPEMIANLKRIGGSSGGAMVGAMLALGYSAEEIEEELKFDKFKYLGKDRWWDPLGVYKGIKAGIRLISPRRADGKETHGLSKGDAVYNWICELVAKKLGNPNATFKNLQEARDIDPKIFKELHITGICVDSDQDEAPLQYFNYENYPDMPIAKAVRISMSFPGAFNAVEWRKKRWIDGGASDNYPMGMFNPKKYMHKDYQHLGHTDVAGNCCTLGFSPKEIPKQKKTLQEKIIEKINESYFGKVLNAVLADQRKVKDIYYLNTVEYENDLSTLQENVTAEQRKNAINKGKKAIKNYMQKVRGKKSYYEHKKYNSIAEKYRNKNHYQVEKIRNFLLEILHKSKNIPPKKEALIRHELAIIEENFKLPAPPVFKTRKKITYKIKKAEDLTPHIKNIKKTLSLLKESVESTTQIKKYGKNVMNQLISLEKISDPKIAKVIKKGRLQIKKILDDLPTMKKNEIQKIKEAHKAIEEFDPNMSAKPKEKFYASIAKLDTSLKRYIKKNNTIGMKFLEFCTHFLPECMLTRKQIYIRQAKQLKNKVNKIRKKMQAKDKWEEINARELRRDKRSILRTFTRVENMLRPRPS